MEVLQSIDSDLAAKDRKNMNPAHLKTLQTVDGGDHGVSGGDQGVAQQDVTTLNVLREFEIIFHGIVDEFVSIDADNPAEAIGIMSRTASSIPFPARRMATATGGRVIRSTEASAMGVSTVTVSTCGQLRMASNASIFDIS